MKKINKPVAQDLWAFYRNSRWGLSQQASQWSVELNGIEVKNQDGELVAVAEHILKWVCS